MVRRPRFALSGYPQHVIRRGNNREACFFDDADSRKYLASLVEAAEKYRCQVHAFVLMTNHVRLNYPGTFLPAERSGKSM